MARRSASRFGIQGVSTRKYARVLPAMAASWDCQVQRVACGETSESSEFARAHAALVARAGHPGGVHGRIEVAWHHVLGAVGLDASGEKHLLGLVRGSSENAAVVKDLLNSLVERGVDARCNACS